MSKKKYDTNNENDIAFNNIVEIEEIATDNVEDVIEDVTVEDTTASGNILSCKVIKSISGNKAIIDFNGYGLIVSTDKKTDFVDVKYTGNIGTPDFKYEVV